MFENEFETQASQPAGLIADLWYSTSHNVLQVQEATEMSC